MRSERRSPDGQARSLLRLIAVVSAAVLLLSCFFVAGVPTSTLGTLFPIPERSRIPSQYDDLRWSGYIDHTSSPPIVLERDEGDRLATMLDDPSSLYLVVASGWSQPDRGLWEPTRVVRVYEMTISRVNAIEIDPRAAEDTRRAAEHAIAATPMGSLYIGPDVRSARLKGGSQILAEWRAPRPFGWILNAVTLLALAGLLGSLAGLWRSRPRSARSAADA
jgi:hypothetical protein